MAVKTTRILKLGYKDNLERSLSLNIKFAKDPNGSGDAKLEQTDVAALAQAFITNGSIFQSAPVSVESVEVITTITEDVTPA